MLCANEYVLNNNRSTTFTSYIVYTSECLVSILYTPRISKPKENIFGKFYNNLIDIWSRNTGNM